MGAWGTAIFSDDFACDIRDEFRDLIGDGLAPEDSTRRLFQKYKSSFRKFPEDEPVFWLAIAATQWKMGRLLDSVRDETLRIIDAGSNLEIWEASGDPALVKKRAGVLQKLRTTLESPQPEAKSMAKRHVAANAWKKGDLVSYRLLSGRFIIIRVIGHHADRGGRFAVCELLHWSGDELPTDDIIRRLPIKVEANRRGISSFMLAEPTPHQKGRDRLVRLGRESKPTQNVELFRAQKSRTIRAIRRGLGRLRKSKPARTSPGYTVFVWKYLDRQLAEIFHVS